MTIPVSSSAARLPTANHRSSAPTQLRSAMNVPKRPTPITSQPASVKMRCNASTTQGGIGSQRASGANAGQPTNSSAAPNQSARLIM
jgi:hypothetical protein